VTPKLIIFDIKLFSASLLKQPIKNLYGFSIVFSLITFTIALLVNFFKSPISNSGFYTPENQMNVAGSDAPRKDFQPFYFLTKS